MGNISACFDWLDIFLSGIWAWCVDAIVDELGIFTSIGFSDGSLVWTIVVRASSYCPVHPESAIGSFMWRCGGDRVILVGRVLIKLRWWL